MSNWVNGDLLTPDNLNNKGPKFNVKDSDYGAVGDGSTDDTTAIANAIIAANAANGTVYFPHGTYRVSAINNSNIANVCLEGESKFGSIIKRVDGSGTIATRMLRLRAAAAGSTLIVKDLTLDGNRSSYSGHGSLNSFSLEVNPVVSQGYALVLIDNVHIVDAADKGIALSGSGGTSIKTAILRNITDDGTLIGDDTILVTAGYDSLYLQNLACKSFQMELNGADSAVRYLTFVSNLALTGRWKHGVGSTVRTTVTDGNRVYAVNLHTERMENLCDNGYGEFHNLHARYIAQQQPNFGGFKIFGGRIIADGDAINTAILSPSVGDDWPDYMEFHGVDFVDEHSTDTLTRWIAGVKNVALNRRIVFNGCKSFSSYARWIEHRSVNIDMRDCHTELLSSNRQYAVYGDGQNNTLPPATFTFRNNSASDRSLILCRMDSGQAWTGTYNFEGNRFQPGTLMEFANLNSLAAPWGTNASATSGVRFNQLQDFVETSDLSMDADGFPLVGQHIRGMRLWYANPLTYASTTSASGAVCTAGGSPGTWVHFGGLL